ncbi:T-complex protein 1 subunit beta-like [Lycorma delicatula]|uniref:T-complex protein 1 subunit beta-like n=1 Tax=Lycorma delicatula TaxID=130591 RepID=UPI003F512B34
MVTWLDQWNKSGQTVALFKLLTKLAPIQARFASIAIDYSLTDSTELALQEQEANNPGCSEMLMACAIQSEATQTPGKEAVAMEAFARALQMLPIIIADNAGYDSAQLISELRAAHTQGNETYGLNMDIGKIGCMKELGITESFVVKRQVLLSAAEAAEMIIRVDSIIKAAPRKREQDRGHC